MRKHAELSDPKSCLNRARVCEMLFVLLGRDDAACDTVRFWIDRRIALGKNCPHDEQIADAERWIDTVTAERAAAAAQGAATSGGGSTSADGTSSTSARQT